MRIHISGRETKNFLPKGASGIRGLLTLGIYITPIKAYSTVRMIAVHAGKVSNTYRLRGSLVVTDKSQPMVVRPFPLPDLLAFEWTYEEGKLE